MFPAETTLAQDGSLVSSDICPFHFRESDKSTLSVNFKNGQAFLLASCLKSKTIICFKKQFSNHYLRQNIKQTSEHLNCEYWIYFVLKTNFGPISRLRLVLIDWKFALKTKNIVIHISQFEKCHSAWCTQNIMVRCAFRKTGAKEHFKKLYDPPFTKIK